MGSSGRLKSTLFLAQHSQLSFRRGDIIVMDENYNGETLASTGWASGTNDRSKKWGNFTAKSVYVVPVVYVQTPSKPPANKPSPRLFTPHTPEEPVSIAKSIYLDMHLSEIAFILMFYITTNLGSHRPAFMHIHKHYMAKSSNITRILPVLLPYFLLTVM